MRSNALSYSGQAIYPPTQPLTYSMLHVTVSLEAGMHSMMEKAEETALRRQREQWEEEMHIAKAKKKWVTGMRAHASAFARARAFMNAAVRHERTIPLPYLLHDVYRMVGVFEYCVLSVACVIIWLYIHSIAWLHLLLCVIGRKWRDRSS